MNNLCKQIRPHVLLAFISLLIVGVEAQSSSGVVEVPFDFFHNEILIQALIDGKGPFVMLVDTGTDPSAIDVATAQSIGLKLSSSGRKSSGGGTETNLAYKCKFSEVVIDGLTAKNVDSAAIDLTKISQSLSRHIDGIFGHSLLNHRIVQIDYINKKLRFFEKMPDPIDAAVSAELPFRYDNDPLIDGVLVNGKTVTANLDTGSSGSFQLSPKAVIDLGLGESASNGEIRTSVGYNGGFQNREGKLQNVKIGNISVDNAPVLFFGLGTGHDRVPWSLNIGNVFLSAYIVTIDYRGKRIRLEKPAT